MSVMGDSMGGKNFGQTYSRNGLCLKRHIRFDHKSYDVGARVMRGRLANRPICPLRATHNRGTVHPASFVSKNQHEMTHCTHDAVLDIMRTHVL